MESPLSTGCFVRRGQEGSGKHVPLSHDDEQTGNLSNKPPAPTSRPVEEHVLVPSTDCESLVSARIIISPYYSCTPPFHSPSIVVPFSPYRIFILLAYRTLNALRQLLLNSSSTFFAGTCFTCVERSDKEHRYEHREHDMALHHMTSC